MENIHERGSPHGGIVEDPRHVEAVDIAEVELVFSLLKSQPRWSARIQLCSRL